MRPGLLALAAAGVLTAACAAQIAAPEARAIATAELNRFCRAEKNCGSVHLVRAQKLNDRWLVDFDAPARKYNVTVEANGNAAVDVWNKTP